MSESLAPDRFPIHYVTDSGYMYFADWQWTKYFINKELLVLDSVSVDKFLSNSEKDPPFTVQKSFFDNELQYQYFILLRLMLGSDHTNIYSLEQSVELIHISLLKPSDYKDNDMIHELDEPVGNWKKFDLISYRKIKDSLELLRIRKNVKKVTFDHGKKKSEAIVFEMFFDDDILGYFIIREIEREDF